MESDGRYEILSNITQISHIVYWLLIFLICSLIAIDNEKFFVIDELKLNFHPLNFDV